MPSQHNQASVQAIKEKLGRSQNLIIADYSGINVAAQTDLRAKIKTSGGEFAVTKNRLIKLALKEQLKDLPADLDSALEGPNAAIYCLSDPVPSAKVLVEFAKDHETLNLKLCLVFSPDGSLSQVLSADDIQKLAKLPGRDQLLAHLVGQLNAPITGLVNVLSGTTRSLVYVLTAIKDQKNNN